MELVGERGFEPPTPWSRTRCSTRLSHSPTVSPLILLHVIRHVLIWNDRLVGTIGTTAQFFCRVWLCNVFAFWPRWLLPANSHLENEVWRFEIRLMLRSVG